MNGRVLVVGNRFEDANWVNAGFGASIDVVYAENRLYRCAQLLNYGLTSHDFFQPSWYVQYLDNEVHEGNTTIDTTGSIRDLKDFSGAITRCTVHRRHLVADDNCGGVGISGRTRDVIVEGCVLRHPANLVRVDEEAQGVVLSNNRFEAAPRRATRATRCTTPWWFPPRPPCEGNRRVESSKRRFRWVVGRL